MATLNNRFAINETTSYQNKMPSRTFIARNDESMTGFKDSKNRLTFLLGTNTADDLKLKPMLLHHSEDTRTLKNFAVSSVYAL